MVSGKGARRKGIRGEIEFFAVLNKFLPERLRIERELSQTRDGGADGKSAGVVIEVKRQERLNLPQWVKQAREAAENSRPLENRGPLENRYALENSTGVTPVVAYRQNGEPWRCLVEMSPLQLAVYMRYKNNLDETAATIAAAHRDLG